MADFSFGFPEDSFLLFNGRKHLRSAAEDLIVISKNELNEFIKKGKRTGIIKLSSQYFSLGRDEQLKRPGLTGLTLIGK